MSFAKGLEAYAKRTKLGIDKAVIAINIDLAVNVINKTPVDTGRARGNWIPTIGEASNDTRENGNSISEATITAQKSSGKVFYLTNNLEYIRKLEHGTSKQAPIGMVGVTMQEIKLAIRKEFKESK